MNGLFAWVLAGLGFAFVTVRERVLAVGIVTVQAVLLVWLAFREAASPNDLVAAAALAVRTVVLAALFLFLAARTRDTRLVRAGLAPLRRAAFAATLALALIWLIPSVGLPSRAVERTILATVAFGLVAAAANRATLLQVLGIVVIENALALAALQLPGTSWLIELGLAFDLTVLAAVAGVLHRKIFAEFGAGDTGVLRSLRD
jgi:hydrogenase-4 membrane subunit HyfE